MDSARGKENSPVRKSFDDSKSLHDRIKDDDIIKQRLSMLKKDSYPSYNNNTPKLNNINISNSNNMILSSHSRKNLTIEIPQSPNLHHNPTQNPYYKI